MQLLKHFKNFEKKVANFFWKKSYTHNSKERHPFGCVCVCVWEGARVLGNVGVAVCWCVCARQVFFFFMFFFLRIFHFLVFLVCSF